MNLLDNPDLKWKKYDEGNKFGYPINYSDAILISISIYVSLFDSSMNSIVMKQM